VLKHAVWLNLVQRRLKEALFLKLVVILVVHGCKFLCLLIEEVEICGALILDITLAFVRFVVPIGFLLPFFVLLVLIISSIVEVVFFLGVFTVCTLVSSCLSKQADGALTFQCCRQRLEKPHDTLK
jgi:hypothetical protein